MQDKKPEEVKASQEAPSVAVKTATGIVAHNEVRRLLHQLNQPLTAISNYARAGILLIDNGMSDTARMKELFEKIDTQSGRTTAFSQELSTAVTKLVQGEQQE